MDDRPAVPFSLASTFAFLQDGGNAPLVARSAEFWRDLSSGNPQSPGAALVARGDGWLVSVYTVGQDTPTWEMHPAGDELLVSLTARMDLVLDFPDGARTIALDPGQACLVPRGVWHRQVVRSPGTYLGATYGKGTSHRPVRSEG